MDPMALVTPAIGLMFWTCVVFSLLVILLRKYAWNPILTAVDKRNLTIENALQAAEKAKSEMAELTANNEKNAFFPDFLGASVWSEMKISRNKPESQ